MSRLWFVPPNLGSLTAYDNNGFTVHVRMSALYDVFVHNNITLCVCKRLEHKRKLQTIDFSDIYFV